MKRKEQQPTPAPQMTAQNYDYFAHLAERLCALRMGAERIAKEYGGARKYVLTAADATMVYTTDGRRGKFTSRDLPTFIMSREKAEEIAKDVKLPDGSPVEITPLVSYLTSLREYAAREEKELAEMRKGARV